MIRKLCVFGLCLLMLASVGCGKKEIQNQEENNKMELIGAGATFPYPLYSKMFDIYHKEFDVRVNYQSIGSGGGVRQIENKTVDFGASDSFLSDKKLSALPAKVLHVPICLGAVVLTYKLPGNPDLKLTGPLVSKMYLGEVKYWDDASIKKLNPNIKLPHLRITPVYRSDGSGTTAIFTDYLAKISPQWLKSVGRGKSVNWKTGIGAKGNEGVTGMAKQTPGSIAYINLAYAKQNNLPVVALKNKSDNFIIPTIESTSLAANGTIPDDTRASITDTDAAKGYPVSGFTWVLVYQDQGYNNRSQSKAIQTKNLLNWMVTKGQVFAEPLDYAPLPNRVVIKAQKIINSIKYENKILK